VRRIGRLRAGTAAQTDERVRLTGEIIGGVLATKMLGGCSGWVGRGGRLLRVGDGRREVGGRRAFARILLGGGSVASCFRWEAPGLGGSEPPAASCGRPTHLPHPPACPPAAWEEPFRQQISGIRRAEAAFIRRTAAIKAFNMGLSAAIIPLVNDCAVLCGTYCTVQHERQNMQAGSTYGGPRGGPRLGRVG
jgi:hypothetical protein